MPKPSFFTESPEGVLLSVKVVPAGSRTDVAGLYGQMLKIKVAAPPEKGKANKAIIDFLAEKLGIKKNAIQIQSGQTSSVKRIMLRGVSGQDVEKLSS